MRTGTGGAELAATLGAGVASRNLELVREAYRLRFDAGRVEETARSLRRFLELLAPDAELAGEGEVWSPCRGRIAITNALVDAARRWSECSFAVEEMREPEPDRVLACGTVLLRPAGTSEVQSSRFADLWTIKEGLVVRIESLGDAHRPS